MKKNFICAAAAAFVAVAFAACGNKSEANAEATDTVAAPVEEVVAAEAVEAVDTVTNDTVVATEVVEAAAPAQN